MSGVGSGSGVPRRDFQKLFVAGFLAGVGTLVFSSTSDFLLARTCPQVLQMWRDACSLKLHLGQIWYNMFRLPFFSNACEPRTRRNSYNYNHFMALLAPC